MKQKMKIAVWKVVAGALSTVACKMYRHVSKRSTCPLCGVEEENEFHALITCDHAGSLWINMRARWPLPSDNLLINTGKE